MAVREFLRAHWPLLTIGVTAVAILCAGVALFGTMPPRSVAMATGPEGGAYHEIGKQYQAELAREGVRLRLVTTGGSLDNLALLQDPRSGVSIALVQGGTVSASMARDLESLGTLFYEPFWLFYRSALGELALDGLRGRKVSIGPEGSGTRVLALELFKRHGIDARVTELLALAGQEAGEKLLAGEIDAAVMLTSWDAPVVRKLLADERVALASFPNADAYVAHYPFLSKVVVPAGVGDLARHRPPADVTLFAPKASLVVRDDLHSALQYLLLSTASHIHSGAGIFQRANRFPAAEGIDLPLSDQATQFYKVGRPFLQNYLPFWMASLFARLLVLLIPILGVLYPMIRFLPMIYDWSIKSRISRLYGELRFLEDEIDAGAAAIDRADMTARLDNLEKKANRLKIPLAYASMMYLLRNHIELVRTRLKASDAAIEPAKP
jgi:TRAP transporter TAXI family solute receptor